MNFLAKVLNRAAVSGHSACVSARPKGITMAVRRIEDEQEDQSLQRQETEDTEPLQDAQEEERAQPLRCMDEEDSTEALQHQNEEEAQTFRRQESDLSQPLRRVEEEEESARALHRQAQEQEEEEDEAQALRRQEVSEAVQSPQQQEEEEALLQTLRREEDEDAANQPLHQADEDESEKALQPARLQPGAEDEMPPEPLPMQALRSDAPAPVATTDGVAGSATVATPIDPAASFIGIEPPFSTPAADLNPSTPAPSTERPHVQIDQIDVVIHEDTPGSGGKGGDSLSHELSRRIRRNYLRGL